MSEDDFESVRKLRDAFNAFMRGERSSEDLAQLLHPEIEYYWHDQRTYPDTPQHLHGAPAVVAFMEQFRDGWEDLVQEPLEQVEAPDGRVVDLVRQPVEGARAVSQSKSISSRSARSEMASCAAWSTSAIAPTL